MPAPSTHVFHGIKIAAGGDLPRMAIARVDANGVEAPEPPSPWPDPQSLPTHVLWLRAPIELDRDGRGAVAALGGGRPSHGVGGILGKHCLSLTLFECGGDEVEAAARAIAAAHPDALAMAFPSTRGFDLDAAVKAHLEAAALRDQTPQGSATPPASSL